MVDAKTLRAAGLFTCVVLVFGLNYIFVGFGLEYCSPIWLAFFRALFGFGGVIVLLLALRTQGQLSMRQKLVAFLLGIPGTALFFGLWFSGGTKILPGLTSVVVYTYPLWVVLLSVLMLKEEPRLLKVGGVLLGFLGVALASQLGFADLGSNAPALVELAVSAFCFAFLNVGMKRFFKGQQLLRANVWQLAGALLPLLVWAVLSSPFSAIRWTPEFFGVVLWLGVLGTSVTFFLWFWLLSNYNASSLGAYSFLSVIVALVSSILLFGESVTLIQAVGVVTIIAAIYLVSKS